MSSSCHHGCGSAPGAACSARVDHQQHHGRVVEARLGLEHPGDPARAAAPGAAPRRPPRRRWTTAPRRRAARSSTTRRAAGAPATLTTPTDTSTPTVDSTAAGATRVPDARPATSSGRPRPGSGRARCSRGPGSAWWTRTRCRSRPRRGRCRWPGRAAGTAARSAPPAGPRRPRPAAPGRRPPARGRGRSSVNSWTSMDTRTRSLLRHGRRGAASIPCPGHPHPRPVTCGVLVSQGAPR